MGSCGAVSRLGCLGAGPGPGEADPPAAAVSVLAGVTGSPPISSGPCESMRLDWMGPPRCVLLLLLLQLLQVQSRPTVEDPDPGKT